MGDITDDHDDLDNDGDNLISIIMIMMNVDGLDVFCQVGFRDSDIGYFRTLGFAE